MRKLTSAYETRLPVLPGAPITLSADDTWTRRPRVPWTYSATAIVSGSPAVTVNWVAGSFKVGTASSLPGMVTSP